MQQQDHHIRFCNLYYKYCFPRLTYAIVQNFHNSVSEMLRAPDEFILLTSWFTVHQCLTVVMDKYNIGLNESPEPFFLKFGRVPCCGPSLLQRGWATLLWHPVISCTQHRGIINKIIPTIQDKSCAIFVNPVCLIYILLHELTVVWIAMLLLILKHAWEIVTYDIISCGVQKRNQVLFRRTIILKCTSAVWNFRLRLKSHLKILWSSAVLSTTTFFTFFATGHMHHRYTRNGSYAIPIRTRGNLKLDLKSLTTSLQREIASDEIPWWLVCSF